jgi:hypothetical protein
MASHIEDFQRPRAAPGSACIIRTTTSVVDEARGSFQTRALLHQGADRGLIAEQHELGVGMTLQSNIGAGNDDCRPEVAPHRHRAQFDLLGHRF